MNNGLLPLQVSQEELDQILMAIEKDPETSIYVNLEEQVWNVEGKDIQGTFHIDGYKKMCLLNGYDDIDYLLSLKDEIKTFEKNQVVY